MREDILWLLERVRFCLQYRSRSSKKEIFQGIYDVWRSVDDDTVMNYRINEAKDLGLIINDSGYEKWKYNDNWRLTDLGEKYLDMKNSDKKMGIMEPTIPKTTAASYVEKTRHIKVKIDPISDEFIPEYKTKGAACCDLKANIGAGRILTVGSGQSVKVPCGFRMQIQPGWEAQLRSRSGLATKVVMITNGIGTIDDDFRDEIQVLLSNFGKEVLEIKHGKRIAQMALKPVYYFDWDVGSLDETDREGGFGSTGA